MLPVTRSLFAISSRAERSTSVLSCQAVTHHSKAGPESSPRQEDRPAPRREHDRWPEEDGQEPPGERRQYGGRTATELQAISKKHVYHVDDQGKVTRLTSTGHQDLTAEDRARLAPLQLQGDSVGERRAGQYPLPEPADRKKKPSEQVAFGGSDLSQATRMARDANNDYGQTRKGKFSSRNYAAARYGKPGSEEEFILVGRSKWPAAHSERQIGIPFLNAGTTNG